MSNSWDEMRKAKEDSFFEEKNKEALNRLAQKQEEKVRPSPITGEPMEQIIVHGVVVDRCPTTGGIWLDAGELEQIVGDMKAKEASEAGWLSTFFTELKSKVAGK
jgi:hypothetical protein